MGCIVRRLVAIFDRFLKYFVWIYSKVQEYCYVSIYTLYSLKKLYFLLWLVLVRDMVVSERERVSVKEWCAVKRSEMVVGRGDDVGLVVKV